MDALSTPPIGGDQDTPKTYGPSTKEHSGIFLRIFTVTDFLFFVAVHGAAPPHICLNGSCPKYSVFDQFFCLCTNMENPSAT
jgi:hypothetical protein